MIRSFIKSWWVPVVLGALPVGLSSGCGGSSSAYTPSPTSARQSLERALTAWQKGESPEALVSGSPSVHAVDSHWQAGEKLERFQILDEEPAEAEKRFAVRLNLQKSKQTAEARYVVLGQGPVWVYREEDYARLMNMDNNPGPPRGKPTRGASARR